MSSTAEIPKVDDRKVRNAAMSRIMNARGSYNRGKGEGTFRAMAREAEKEVGKAHMYLLTPYQPASSRGPSRQVVRAQWRRTGTIPEGYQLVQREEPEADERKPRPMSARLLKRSRPIKTDGASNAKGGRGRRGRF